MNFKFKNLLIILLLIIFLSIGCVSASDNLDTNTTVLSESVNTDSGNYGVIGSSDSDPILSADGDGSFSELQGLINNANDGDTITLGKNYMYNASSDSNLMGGVVLNKSLTIIGNGKYISGNNKVRILNITSDNIILRNIVFQDGHSLVKTVADASNVLIQGAAVYSNNCNNILIDGCTFKSNVQDTYYTGTTDIIQGEGLSIYVYEGANVTVNNSVFNAGRSSATNWDDSIYFNYVKNITIHGNTFNTGIYHYFYAYNGDNIMVSKNTFLNTFAGDGHDRYLIRVETFYNLTFSNNTRGLSSAAQNSVPLLYTNNINYVNITGNTLQRLSFTNTMYSFNINNIGNECYFTYNKLITHSNPYNTGNMILLSGNRATTKLYFISNKLDGLSSGRGYILQVVRFNETVFYNNTFNNIQRSEGDQVKEAMRLGEINYLNFTKNNITNSRFPMVLSIYTITNCTFRDILFNEVGTPNAAADISLNYPFLAIFSACTYLEINDCTFKNCYSWARSSESHINSVFLDIRNCPNTTFHNNVIDNWYLKNSIQSVYGFINTRGSTVMDVFNNSFSNCNITGNIVRGLFYNSAKIRIYNNTFTDSYSYGSGGILYNYDNGYANFTENVFINIHADTGGVFYNTGAKEFVVVNNNFTNCYANNSGVIYSTGNNVFIHINNITDCYANIEAGAFHIEGTNNITVSNNTFTNISAGSYGVIYADGASFSNNNYTDNHASDFGVFAMGSNTILENEIFINNYANSSLSRGGVLYLDGDSNTMNNVNITNCSAANGGAIYNKGDNNIFNNISIVDSNCTSFGGAVYSLGDYLSMNNLTVHNSSSLLDGGVFYVVGGYSCLNHTNLVDVYSNRDGGAVYWIGANGKVLDLNITNSNASRFGGAIYWNGNDGDISDLNIDNSNAGSGGAIYIVANDVHIKNAVFDHVFATDDGGAIYVQGSGFTLYNAKLDDIHANYGGAVFLMGPDNNLTLINFTNIHAANNGGVIYGSGTDSSILDRLTFDDTYAYNGGAIYWAGSDCDLQNLRFTNIYATATGGAIYWAGDRSRFKNLTFINISSVLNGGSIFLAANDCNLSEILVKNSTSDFNGGALYLSGKNCIMNDSNFVENSAVSAGGAISWNVENGKIYNSNFSYNTANNGAAIYVIGDSQTFYNLNIFDNNATSNAGAIYLIGANSEVFNSTFTNNRAGGSAGSIQASSSDFKLYDSKFISNNAVSNGGAVNLIGPGVFMYNVNFTDNHAGMGGAVYIGADNANISYLNFIDNSAVSSAGSLYMGGLSGSNASNINITNSSAERGGSIYWESNNGILSKVRVNGSSAIDGGAIYWKGNFATIDNMEFVNTSAIANGGILYVYGSDVHIDKGTFNYSTAENGGAIYWIGHFGSVNNADFTNNNASYGGAIYLVGSEFNLNGTIFTDNNATYGGGVYWAGSGNISRSEFTRNRAHSGSALYNALSLNILNTVVLDNHADIRSLDLNAYNTRIDVVGEATLRGYDNFLNGIWTTSTNIGVQNVTYWGAEGVSSTGNGLVQPVNGANPNRVYVDSRLAGMNVSFIITKVKGNIVKFDGETVTNIYGIAQANVFKSKNNFTIFASRDDDAYYGNISNNISFESEALEPTLDVSIDDYIPYNTNRNITVQLAYQVDEDTIGANTTVELYLNDKYLCNVTLVEGVGILDTILPLNVSTGNVITAVCKDTSLYFINSTVTNISSSKTFNVVKSELIIDIIGKSTVLVDELVNISISGPKNYTKNIEYIAGNDYHGVVQLNGSYNVSLVYNKEGTVDVLVYAEGDDNYLSGTSSFTITVIKNNVSAEYMNITGGKLNPFNVGDVAVITVKFNETDVTGKVNITVNGVDYITEINNAYANVSVYYLTEGEYNVSMVYYGDNKYNPTEPLNTTLKINRIPVSVNVKVKNESIFVGQNAVFDINVTSNVDGYVVNGFVTVNVDNKNYNVSISNGTGSLTVSGLSNRTYTVSVNYGGDYQFINFTNSNAAHIYVNKVPIKDITVTLENNIISVGEDAVYTINVNANEDNYIVNGFVTVKVDNKDYNVSIVNGVGHLSVSGLNNGSYKMNVTYAGDGTFETFELKNVAEVTVEKVPISSIRINPTSSNINIGDDAEFNIIVVPNKYVFNDYISIKIDNKTYNVPINNNTGYLLVPGLGNGHYDVDVSYGGSSVYNTYSEERATSINVNKINTLIDVTAQNSTILVGQNAIYDIQVTAANNMKVNGSVTVTVDGKHYTVAIINGTGKLSINTLPEGVYRVDASYEGNDIFNPASAQRLAPVTVFKVGIESIKVTPRSADIYVGQDAVYDIVLTAEEAGYVVNGFVTVKLNNKEYIVSISNGKGSLTVSGLNNATYLLDVIYAGDDTFDPAINSSTAKVAVHKVGINNIDVKAVSTPIYVGQDASYIINVTSKVNGYLVNGFVTIKIDNKEQNVSITDGIGRVSISNLAKGSYTMNVTYAGDNTFSNYSVINKARVDVNKVNVNAINVAPRNSSIFVGQDAVYDINVTTATAGYVVNGYVTVSVGGKQYNVSISNGKGSLTVPGLAKGSYTMNITYAGDNVFNNYSVINKARVDVNKVNVNAINVAPRNSSIFVGQDAVYDINVTTSTAGYVVNGYVTVSVGGKQYNVSISNGKGSLTVPGLAKGSYTMNITYAGDNVFNNYSVTNKAKVDVNKVNIKQISVTPSSSTISVGEDAVYNINITPNAAGYTVNGFVTVNVGGKLYNVSVSNGKGSLTLSGLDNGSYTIGVNYAGDNTFNGLNNNSAASLVVGKVNINNIKITPNNENIYVGENAEYDIEITSDKYVVNGFATVKINNVNYNVSIINGKGHLTVSGLAEGTYGAEVSYAGDDIFNSISNTSAVNVKVNKITTRVSITPGLSNILVGEDAVYNILVTSNVNGYNVNGFVTVTVNNKNYNVSVVNGRGSLTIFGLTRGNYLANVSYAGDNVFMPSSAINQANVVVEEVAIVGISVTPIKSSIIVGEDAEFNISVSSSKYLVDGYVTVNVDDVDYNVSVSNGIGHLTVSALASGNYPVYVSYAGDDTFGQYVKTRVSSINVNKIDIKSINITPVKSDIYVGEDAVLKVNVTPSNFTVNDYITLIIDDKEYNVSLSNGIGSLTVKGLAAGVYRVDASYSGNDQFYSMDIKKVTRVNVNKVPIKNIVVTPKTNPIFVGQEATLNINVNSNVTGYKAKGSAVVTINNKEYIVPITDGKGSLTVSGLANDTYTVDVIYLGDETFESFTNNSATKIAVNKVAISNITVTPKNQNIFVGENANFTVQINSNNDMYPVNGNVLVTVNNIDYNVVIVNGKGSLSVSGLANGSYDVDVAYAGDNVFTSYNKDAIANVKVNKVDISNIVVSPASKSILVGESADFVITVTANKYTVNGYVTVDVNGRKENVSVNNGVGVLTVQGLENTTYTISVHYDGDNRFNSFDKNNAAKLFVNKVDISNITVSPASNSIFVGDSADFVITVTANKYTVNGYVTVDINGKKENVSITEGIGVLTVQGLENTTYTINVHYDGDNRFNSFNKNNAAKLFVNKIAISSIEITPTTTNIFVGDSVDFNVKITSDNNYPVNGYLTVKIGNSYRNISITNNTGSFTASGLEEGSHIVGLSYYGDNQFGNFTNNNAAKITVEKINTVTGVTPVSQSILVGEDAEFTVTVNSNNPNYTVNGYVTVEGRNVSIINGTGIIRISGLAYGNHSFYVKYGGNNQFNPSNAGFIDVEVNKVNITTISVDYSARSILVGQSIELDISVFSEKYVVNGSVLVSVSNKDYNVSIINGKGVLVVDNLLEGEYPVRVYYAGDDTFNDYAKPSVNFIVVYKADTFIMISPVYDNIFVGEDALFDILLQSNEPGYIVNGSVIATVNGNEYNVSIVNGQGSLRVSGLPEGIYNANVRYNGSEVYKPVSSIAAVNLTVNKVNISSIDITPVIQNIYVDDNAEFNITVTSAIPDRYVVNGYVTVTINNKTYNVPITNGKGTFSVNGLTNNTYLVDFDYAGDATYNSLTNSRNITVIVNRIPTTINVNNITLNVGDVANITAIINDKRVSGNVTFIVDDNTYIAGIIDGVASISVTGLNTSCNTTISAYYSGDYKFENSSATAHININKINGTIDLKVTDIVAGDAEKVVIILPADLTNATISILFDGEPVTDYTVDNNIITFNRVVQASGPYTVSVNVNDDVKYKNMAASKVFNVSKISADNYTIAINVNNSNVFEEIPVTVSLPSDANGVLAIIVDGEVVNSTVPVVNGSASYVLDNLSSGNHTISVNFENEKYGDKTFNTTVEILKVKSAVIVHVPEDAHVNKTILINVTPIGSTGSINATVNGKKYDVVNNTIDVSDLRAGIYTVMVYLDSDDNYLSSFNSSMFTVSLNDVSLNLDEITSPILVDETIIIRAVLSENVTGDVVFNINGVNYTASIVDSNVAEFNFTPVKEGNVSVIATYMGSDVYSANVSNTILFDVIRNNITFVDVNVSDIMFGDIEIITFTLNASDASGIAVITVGNDVYETSVINGSSMISISNLANGTYDVNIVYNGNSKYYGTNASNITFTVNKYASFVNFTVEDIMILDDEVINITIPEDAIGYISIGINDGELIYLPINGTTSYVASGLNVGNYSVTVVYYGNEKYNSSEASANFTVSIYESDMNITYNDYINSTDALHIIASLPNDATGVITVNIGDKNYAVPVENGTAKLDISGLEGGDYTGVVTYSGDYKYDSDSFEFNITVEPDYVILEVDDVVKYYSGTERLAGNLSTSTGVILSNETVYIIINGITYNKTTNDEGKFSIGINLPSGEYEVLVIYNESSRYDPVTQVVNVTVLNTIIAKDLIKQYRNKSQFFAYFTDDEGNALVNTTVTFNINGVFYNRTTNASGWAKLNINLPSGQYIITSYNPVTDEKIANNITVLSTIIGYDLVKVYRNGSQYSVFFTDSSGNALVNTEVSFNINGVFYTRKTSDAGWATLNINLAPGEYIITAHNSFTGESLSNKITVLSKIIENHDLVKEYGNRTPFVVRIIGNEGNIVGEGELVTFNINGVMYNRYTNASGYASLNINLPEGKYIITTEYGGCLASNKITVI